jgi:Ca2+-binding EF-hand superfamily protein
LTSGRLFGSAFFQVKTIFQVFDLDGSGRVSAQELTSSLTLAMGGTPEQRRQMVFKVWDTYGKGTISKQEFVDVSLFEPALLEQSD